MLGAGTTVVSKNLILALMALINVTALLLLRREVIRESELLKAPPLQNIKNTV